MRGNHRNHGKVRTVGIAGALAFGAIGCTATGTGASGPPASNAPQNQAPGPNATQTLEVVPVTAATPAQLETSRTVLERRLAASGVKAQVDAVDGSLRVRVSPTDAANVRSIVEEHHQLLFRPVLRTVAATPGAGTQIPVDAADPDATVTLSERRGDATQVLGPSVVGGEAIESASIGDDAQTGQWVVRPIFSTAGIQAFNKVAAQCYAKESSCPTGQLAIVVDGQLVSAPEIHAPSFSGDQIQLSGNFTEEAARRTATAISRSLPIPLQVKGS